MIKKPLPQYAMTSIAISKEPIALYWPDAWGLFQLTGADRARFLHNQTTQQIQGLKPGQWTETIFVNSTGRTLDLATVLVQEDYLWVRVSPQRRQFLAQWLERYLFPLDKVEVQDISLEQGFLTVLGPQAADFFRPWDFSLPQDGEFSQFTWSGVDLLVTPETGLDLPGFTLWFPHSVLSPLQNFCLEQNYPLVTPEQWHYLRLQQGRPEADCELTEDYNPLEAGLWRAIAFDKGCYIGQETIARLNTYQGVKQRLWGLDLEAAVAPLTPLTLAGEKVGVVTSVAPSGSQAIGLGYVKTKAGGAGLCLQAGTVNAHLLAVPYLRHEYFQPAAGRKS